MADGVEQMNEHANLALAKQQVAAIKAFYIHLAVFILVMSLLLAVDVTTDPEWWVQWPFLGWGAGVLAHALLVFGETPRLIANWEARKVEAIKRRLDERALTSMKSPNE